MGEIRGLAYDNVIGVGGTSREPQENKIARRLTWVGDTPHKFKAPLSFRGPLVAFDRFWCPDRNGPPLHYIAPNLAKYIYETNRRFLIHTSLHDGTAIDEEIKRILQLVGVKGASPGFGEVSQREVITPDQYPGPTACARPATMQSVAIALDSRSASCSNRAAGAFLQRR
jgi:hypothetical protein